ASSAGASPLCLRSTSLPPPCTGGEPLYSAALERRYRWGQARTAPDPRAAAATLRRCVHLRGHALAECVRLARGRAVLRREGGRTGGKLRLAGLRSGDRRGLSGLIRRRRRCRDALAERAVLRLERSTIGGLRRLARSDCRGGVRLSAPDRGRDALTERIGAV